DVCLYGCKQRRADANSADIKAGKLCYMDEIINLFIDSRDHFFGRNCYIRSYFRLFPDLSFLIDDSSRYLRPSDIDSDGIAHVDELLSDICLVRLQAKRSLIDHKL